MLCIDSVVDVVGRMYLGELLLCILFGLMITFPEVVTSHNEDGSAIVTLNGHYID